jgi:hypothetical protein
LVNRGGRIAALPPRHARFVALQFILSKSRTIMVKNWFLCAKPHRIGPGIGAPPMPHCNAALIAAL